MAGVIHGFNDSAAGLPVLLDVITNGSPSWFSFQFTTCSLGETKIYDWLQAYWKTVKVAHISGFSALQI